MREQQNLPSVRPALILTSQATNPIPLGQPGLWYDGSTLWLVAADGQANPLTSTGLAAPVRLATAAALPANTYSSTTKKLTATANGALSIDSVATANGNRVLVKNEVTASNNGIYVVTQKGTAGTPYILTRATDFDSSDEIRPAMRFTVAEGTVNADTEFKLTTDGPITLDTTSLSFS